MLRVDLPSAHSTHGTQLPRPIRAVGHIVPAGTVARNALIARPACTLHMQDAGQHEQARFYGTPPRPRHRRTSTSAYRLLRTHLVT